MERPIYYSKAVMGGGKSYSAIRSYCDENYREKRGTIYCVPTKELAEEIRKDFQSQKEDDYSGVSEFEFEGDNLPESEPLKIHVKIINSDHTTSVSNDLAKAIQESKYDILIITHSALFDISKENLHHLKNWNVAIDEDPNPLECYGTQDTADQSVALTQLASELAGSEEIIEFDLNAEQREYINASLKEEPGTVYNEATKDFINFLVRGTEKLCLLHKSEKKDSWFGIEFKPLKRIVQHAHEVTLLCSKMSILTKLYMDRYDIEIKDSLIKATNATYPVPLQKKVTVYRIWDSRDHSLNHMEKFGIENLSSRLSSKLDGSEFIVRTNDKHKSLLRSHDGFKERVSRVTNGLNYLSEYNNIVDTACYNPPSDSNHIYSFIDKWLGISNGSFEKAVTERENLEPSAQAVCRIGFRNIHEPDHDDYMVIVPDKRTEDYLKEHYLPEANYAGSIIKEKAVDKGGRKAGSVNQVTAAKVSEVDRLRAAGTSLNEAVKIVGIGKATYNRCKKLESE